MTEKITDEELVDLLEALKRAHGMGVCSKAVKLAQRGADVFPAIVAELQEYRNAAKRTSA
ncbi:hypothetical protein AADL90_24320 [Escherichia coli]